MVDLMEIVVNLNDEFFSIDDNSNVFNEAPYDEFGCPFSYASTGNREQILLFDNVIFNPENDCDWCEDDEYKLFKTEEEFVIDVIKKKVNAFYEYAAAVKTCVDNLGENND